MKKIIFLLAAAAIFAATGCDSDDAGKDPGNILGNGTYVGTVTVTTPAFEKDDVEVKVTFADDRKTAKIEMFKVKFAETMPVTLDIKIPGVTAKEVSGSDGMSLSGENIIPLVGTNPYPLYTITGLTGTVTASELTLSMTMGAFPTTYSGTAEE